MQNESNHQINNRTMPPCTVIPVLMYPSLTEAITWLTAVAGFKERWRIGNHRAQLTLMEDTIAIGEYVDKESAGPVSPRRGKRRAHSMLVRVPDVMKHYKNAVKKGACIVQLPTDFLYGEKQYSVKDIGNHIWTFSQSMADLAPEDWGGTTAVPQ